jgi:hypothetical protein
MGCVPSKPVSTSAEPPRTASSSNKKVSDKKPKQHSEQSESKNEINYSSNNSPVSRATNHPISPIVEPSSVVVDPTAENTKSRISELPIDPAWKSIWESQKNNIIDPMDIHAVLSECISEQINHLSVTEITFLQRRIRQVVSGLPKASNGPQNPAHKMMNRLINPNKKVGNGSVGSVQSTSSTTSNQPSTSNITGSAPNTNLSHFPIPSEEDLVESRHIVEKYHLLDELAFKRVFAVGQHLEGATTALDPLQCLYLLASYFSSDYIWDRTSVIAIKSAAQAELVLDVNLSGTQQKKELSMPQPISLHDFAPIESMDISGASFSSISYLISLGLRKSYVLFDNILS